MEESEGSVAQMVASEAKVALRGQRNHMVHEHQVLLDVPDHFLEGHRNEEIQSQRTRLTESYMSMKLNTSRHLDELKSLNITKRD